MARRNPVVREAARALLPLRKLAARFALVDLERMNREQHVAIAGRDLVERVDIVLGEYWRRSEGFDARLATLLQQLEEKVSHLDAEVRSSGRDMAGLYALVIAPDSKRPESGAGESESAQTPPVESQSPADPHTPTVSLSRQRLFDWRERGTYENVLRKLAPYRRYIEGHAPLVDLGCGRGEFLELARESGVAAYGVDLSAESVAEARARGLDARQADLFEHMSAVTPGSLGSVVSSQVVEHLPPDRLPELMDLISASLRSGGICIIETPNPATFATHVQSFWRDPTHVRPVPAAALKFWAQTAGLAVDEIAYSAPVPESDRLKKLPTPGGAGSEIAVAFNGLVEQLNDLLYGYQDYALIASKP